MRPYDTAKSEDLFAELQARQMLLTSGYCPYCARSLADLSHECRMLGSKNYHSEEVQRQLTGNATILQGWAVQLPLRHQGVLVSAVRGPDSAAKEDPAKAVVRAYRADVLNAYCGSAKKSTSFIEHVDVYELARRTEAFVRSFDHYPVHFVLHLMHASQITGYKRKRQWLDLYNRLAQKMHLNPETEEQMDARLALPEDAFHRASM